MVELPRLFGAVLSYLLGHLSFDRRMLAVECFELRSASALAHDLAPTFVTIQNNWATYVWLDKKRV